MTILELRDQLNKKIEEGKGEYIVIDNYPTEFTEILEGVILGEINYSHSNNRYENNFIEDKELDKYLKDQKQWLKSYYEDKKEFQEYKYKIVSKAIKLL